MIYLKDLETVLQDIPFRLFADGRLIYGNLRYCMDEYGDHAVESLAVTKERVGYTIRLI